MKKIFFKLDNKGFGLQFLLVCILVLMMLLVFSAALANRIFNDSDDDIKVQIDDDININKPVEKIKTYEDLENEIKDATIIYQNNNYTNLVEGEKITVTINNLIKEELLSEVLDIKDNTSCTGYGMFSLNGENINHKAYIKCSNYVTEGYKEIYDIK